MRPNDWKNEGVMSRIGWQWGNCYIVVLEIWDMDSANILRINKFFYHKALGKISLYNCGWYFYCYVRLINICIVIGTIFQPFQMKQALLIKIDWLFLGAILSPNIWYTYIWKEFVSINGDICMINQSGFF